MGKSTRSTGAESASEVVRAAIVESGLSLSELSRRTGVDTATLSRFVNEQASVTLTTLEMLAGELGVRVVRARRQAPRRRA